MLRIPAIAALTALAAVDSALVPAPSRADECEPGIITTVAGDGWMDENGQGRYSGDGGPATQASLNWPPDLALGTDGSIYIADARNQRIRKVDPGGVITTVAGDGWSVGERPPRGRFAGDGGPATEASLNLPHGVDVGADGSIYIADTDNNRVRKVAPDGIITTFAGDGRARYTGDGGPATEASLCRPWHVTVTTDGCIYIADLDNHRIRKVDTNGVITTVAGDGNARHAGDGGPAVQASLNRPRDVAIAADGTLYIAELDNHRVRKVAPDGIITTIAGSGGSGWGRGGYAGDGGPAAEARLHEPSSVAIGPDGSLYIADANNWRIRKINPNGIITTVAGNGDRGYSGDRRPPTQVSIDWPFDVEVGPDGTLYIADLGNDLVRRVRPWPCRPQAAKALADELRAEAGESRDAWREAAELYLTANAWDEALAAAERLLTLAPEADESARLEAEVLAARAYAAQRDDHEARRRLMRVLARGRDPAVLREAADEMVNLYLLRGERAQAIATLNDLLLRTPDRNLLRRWVSGRLKELAGD